MTTATYPVHGFHATIFHSREARLRVVLEALADHGGRGNAPGPLARTLHDRGIRPWSLPGLLQQLVDDGHVVVRRVADGVIHVALTPASDPTR